MTIVNDQQQIQELISEFQEQLKKEFTKPISLGIGWPGGSRQVPGWYNAEMRMWYSCVLDEPKGYYWNGFGFGKPSDRNTIIDAAINISFIPNKKTYAGYFAKDENDEIAILHKGKIRHKKAGRGMDYFFANFDGELVTASNMKTTDQYCFVSKLNDPKLGRNIQKFAKEITKIKRL